MNQLFTEIKIALHSVWNRRWIALIIAWIICILGWLAVAFFPNSYQSEARVFADMQSLLSSKIGISQSDRARQIELVQQTLVSSTNLEKVIRSTALGNDIATPREMEREILSLRKDIKISSDQDNLFKVEAQVTAKGRSDADTSKLARDVVQKLIDIFVETNLAGGRGETSDTLDFLDKQLAEKKKALDAAEQRRVEFEREHLGVLPGYGSISSRLTQARSQLQEVEAQLISAHSALNATRAQLAGTPPTIAIYGGGAPSALSQARGQLNSAYAKGLTDDHPDVVILKKEIAQMERQGAGRSQNTTQPNPAYNSLQSLVADRQATVSGLEARRSALAADVAQMSNKQIEEPRLASEQGQIEQDYEVAKEQYNKLLADREDVKLRGEVETETDAVKFRVIDPPTLPVVPVAPNRALLLVGVLIIANGAGIGGAFLMGMMRASYSTMEKLEQNTGYPVLGTISQVMTDTQNIILKRKLRLFYGSCGALLGVFTLLLLVELFHRSMVA